MSKEIAEEKKRLDQKEAKKQGFFQTLMSNLFGGGSTTKTPVTNKKEEKKNAAVTASGAIAANASLKDQVRALLDMPDEKYDDKLLTSELRKFILDNEKEHNATLSDYK